MPIKGAAAAAAVTQPCHLILAASDKMTPLKQAQTGWYDSHSTITEIADAGHMLPVNILTRSICLLPSFWRHNDIGIISFYGVCNDICFSVF